MEELCTGLRRKRGFFSIDSRSWWLNPAYPSPLPATSSWTSSGQRNSIYTRPRSYLLGFGVASNASPGAVPPSNPQPLARMVKATGAVNGHRLSGTPDNRCYPESGIILSRPLVRLVSGSYGGPGEVGCSG